MIEHKDVPEHGGCNPGTKHPMVLYCETQLSKLVAERCDCSEAEGYLCPTHATLDKKKEKYSEILQSHYSLCCKVEMLRAAVKKYGQHHAGCMQMTGRSCTCGFDQVLS